MAMQMTIKNTFIDLLDDTNAMASKRSSSLPRSWKPTAPMWSAKDKLSLPSDVSTVDSEERWSDIDPEAQREERWSDLEPESQREERWSDVDPEGSSGGLSSTESDGEQQEEEEQSLKTVLCLSEVIVADGKPKSTKLSSKARLFQPVITLPMDLRAVLIAAHAALCGCPKIFNAHMSEGALGGTTNIVGYYARGSMQVFELAKTVATVKTALLDAAAESTNTYVIGYEKRPFTDVGHCSFSANIGSVSPMQEDTMCWDTIQKGFCPRRSTCRWCHLNESDMANVVITLIEVD